MSALTGHVARGGVTPLNFGLSENFLSKLENLGLKCHILENVGKN